MHNLRSFACNLRNRDRNLRTPILKRAFLGSNNDSAIGGFPSIWRAATSAGKARYQTPVRRFAFKLLRFAPQSRRFALRLRRFTSQSRGFAFKLRRFTYQPRKFTPLPHLLAPLRSPAASFTLPVASWLRSVSPLRGLPHVAPPLSSFVHAVSPVLSPAASLSSTHHSATQSCRSFSRFRTSTARHG